MVVDKRIAELLELRDDLRRSAEQVRRITEELSAERLDATSPSGTVRATVTGQGGLVDLHIAADAVGPRTAHPGLLATEIVDTVRAARAAAADRNRRRMHAVVPAMYPSDEEATRDQS